MSLADIKNRNRKTITLPNGLAVVIRKLTGMDYVSTGSIPDTIKKIQNTKADELTIDQIDPAFIKFTYETALKAVVSCTDTDGKTVVLTLKTPGTETETELSLYDDQDSLNFLVSEVFNLITPGGADASGVTRFPQESKANS